MSLAEIIALTTGALALVLSLLALYLDARILRHQDRHHGLLSELHHHHIGRHREPDMEELHRLSQRGCDKGFGDGCIPTERLVDEQALIEMDWEDD